MEKVSCPNCNSMKTIIILENEANHVFDEKTEFVIGRRALPRKKKVLVSYDRTIEYKCRKCGQTFTHTEKINKI